MAGTEEQLTAVGALHPLHPPPRCLLPISLTLSLYLLSPPWASYEPVCLSNTMTQLKPGLIASGDLLISLALPVSVSSVGFV